MIICSGLPAGSTYAGDRAFFRQALETRSFAIGDYQIGRITRKATSILAIRSSTIPAGSVVVFSALTAA
jgi:hypothetical protein